MNCHVSSINEMLTHLKKMHLIPVIFQITQPTGILETFVLERSARIIFTRRFLQKKYMVPL